MATTIIRLTPANVAALTELLAYSPRVRIGKTTAEFAMPVDEALALVRHVQQTAGAMHGKARPPVPVVARGHPQAR